MPSRFTFRPPTFERLPPEHLATELDKHLPRLFDAHASLNATAVKAPAFGGSFATTSGLNGVTGNLTIPTGLSTVKSVVASLESGSGVPLNLWVTAGVNKTTPSSIDIFVWKPTSNVNNTPIAATGQVTIHWYATGDAETTT